MFESCLFCLRQFEKTRAWHTFCSRHCLDTYRNQQKPRKTGKRYSIASAKKKVNIPEEDLEIIRGCLLGDACLILQTDGFHRMSICHSNKQFEYLNWKRTLLPSIFICNEPPKNSVQSSIHSISHKDLTEIYGSLYRNKRKIITRRYLDLLTPTSLLFWFLDDGTRIKASGNAFIICSDSFSISENRAIAKWFWQSFKIKAFILESHGGFTDKTYYRLRFRKEDSLRLFHIMSQSRFFNELPDTMKYKFDSYL